MVDREGGEPGERQHIEELHCGPLPTVGFAADDGHRRGALHGEGEEDHQRQRAAEGHVLVQRGLQAQGVRIGLGSIERTHRRDHHLARQHAR